MNSWAVFGTIAATYAGLVSSLVLLYVRSLRNSYDARVADLKAYNAQTLELVREQQAVERLRATATDKALVAGQATEAVYRALPVGKDGS